MTAEAGPSIGMSAGPSGPAVETSIGSISAVPSLPDSGGSSIGSFSMRELMDNSVDVTPNFHIDRPLLVQELAMSDKLFTTIAAPKPKEEGKPSISLLFDLQEVTINPQSLSSDTAFPVNALDRNQFEVMYLSESLRAEDEAAETAVLPAPEITVETFQTESLTPIPFLDVPAIVAEIDLPEVEAPIIEVPPIESPLVVDFLTATKAAETKADTELVKEIESFVAENFAAEPELASILHRQLETMVEVPTEPETEISTDVQAEPSAPAMTETTAMTATEAATEAETRTETQVYVDTEILLPKLVLQTQTEMASEESKKQVTAEKTLDASTPPPVKATFWDVYHIKQVAQKSATALKERTKRATTLVRRAFSTNAVDPSEAIRREARILDDIDAPKGPQILDFKLPEIAPEIATMPDEDLESEIYAQAKVGQIIEERAPVVTIAELIGQEYLPFERLPKAARRTIIERDAKHVNQPSPNGSFQDTLKLELVTNDEIEIETEKTANPPNKLLAA